MRRNWKALVAVGVVLGVAAPGRADDQTQARAVVAKAIKAMGGEANLKQFKGASWKGKGKFYALGGQGLDYTAEWAFQGPKKYRVAIDAEIGGQKVQQILVINGDKGWVKINDLLMDMNKETLEEQQEQVFINWVTFVMPAALLDKSFELSLLGEMEVDKRPAVGVRAVRKGHRALNLYFDKETGLLVRAEYRVKDIQGFQGGKEVTQEVLVSDHQEVNGVKQAMKVTVKWDGKPYVEAELSEFKYTHRLDDDLFAKP
jgi:outer membrane lipoprotein-sorting protein